jgi:5-methyltetrahydrofolate--homocysteine methyltransferase
MLLGFDSKIILYDGAMGTMLQKRGLKPGNMPDIMNITTPDAIEEVHRLYIEAGSNIICTNTFGANAFGLRDTEYTPEEVITAAVNIAKRAIETADTCSSHKTKIALDIGPIGQLLEPFGDLEIDEAIDMFKQQMIAGEKAGADFIAIETIGDLNEMEAALTAAKNHTNLSVLATMTFDKTGRTYMGVPTIKYGELAESFGVAALGMNCSLEPEVMYPVAAQISKETNLPLIVKLNAGLPEGKNGDYDVSPEEFALQLLPYLDLGMRIVGGCCGTSPDYIKELKKVFQT